MYYSYCSEKRINLNNIWKKEINRTVVREPVIHCNPLAGESIDMSVYAQIWWKMDIIHRVASWICGKAIKNDYNSKYFDLIIFLIRWSFEWLWHIPKTSSSISRSMQAQPFHSTVSTPGMNLPILQTSIMNCFFFSICSLNDGNFWLSVTISDGQENDPRH